MRAKSGLHRKMLKQMKKVLISADIEGMEGNVSRIGSNRGNMDYALCRRRLAEDVNAAVRACFDSGYDEVYVCDGHGDMENLIIEDMDPRCKLVSGAMRSSLQMEGIDSSFDAYISFGHAGAGLTLGGTSLLIVVGVALETVKQIESQMLVSHYKSLLE